MRNIFRKFALVAALTASALAPSALAQAAPITPWESGEAYANQGVSYARAANIMDHASAFQINATDAKGNVVGGAFAVGNEFFHGFSYDPHDETFGFEEFTYSVNPDNTLSQTIECASLSNGTLTGIVDSDFQKSGPEATITVAPDGTVTRGGGAKDDILEKRCLINLQSYYNDSRLQAPTNATDLRTSTKLLPSDGAPYAKQGPIQAMVEYLFKNGNVWRTETFDTKNTIVSEHLAGGGLNYQQTKDPLKIAYAFYDSSKNAEGAAQRLVCYQWMEDTTTVSIITNFNNPKSAIAIQFPSHGLFSQPTPIHGAKAEDDLNACMSQVKQGEKDESSKIVFGKYTVAGSPMRHYSVAPLTLTVKR